MSLILAADNSLRLLMFLWKTIAYVDLDSSNCYNSLVSFISYSIGGAETRKFTASEYGPLN